MDKPMRKNRKGRITSEALSIANHLRALRVAREHHKKMHPYPGNSGSRLQATR